MADQHEVLSFKGRVQKLKRFPKTKPHRLLRTRIRFIHADFRYAPEQVIRGGES